MAEVRECRYAGLPGGRATAETPRSCETDAVLEEALVTIREDEVEVYDLGFIVEEHDERRLGLLEHWQRLETLDSDEALETNRRGPMPEEALSLRRTGVPAAWRPGMRSVEHADAERNEQEFAETTGLLVDPAVDGPKSVAHRGGRAVCVPDRNRPPGVGLYGNANGIATGFGTSVTQDIGARGFAVGERPALVPGEQERP
jgi:hypothetical protein